MSVDPYWDSLAFCAQFQGGAHGGTTCPADIPSGVTMTAEYVGAAISNVSPLYGSLCYSVPSNGPYLTTPLNAAYNGFTTSARWTVDFWWYLPELTNGYSYRIVNIGGSDGTLPFQLWLEYSSSTLYLIVTPRNQDTAALTFMNRRYTLTASAAVGWYHVEVSYATGPNTAYVFLNGTICPTWENFGNTKGTGSYGVVVGGIKNTSSWSGSGRPNKIQMLRLLPGVTRHTADFTTDNTLQTGYVAPSIYLPYVYA
jgi:hypothetical protein